MLSIRNASKYLLVLISISLAACNPATQVSTQDLPVQITENQPTVAAPPTAISSPTPTLTPTPSKPEFNISVANFRRENDSSKVDVCIDLPDTQDWMISNANLHVNGSRLPLSGGELLEYTAALEDGSPGRRCDTLFFDLPLDVQPRAIVLEVVSVAAMPREGEYCKFLLEKVQPTLQARDSGILLSCSEETGYSKAQVTAHPDNLSQAEAEATAFSSEYFTIDGSWSFPAQALPTITPFPPVALDDPNAAPYALFQTLNQVLASNLAEPGWLYTLENWEHDFDRTDARTLADGSILPQNYRRATWYHLDDAGRVDQMASAILDADDNILETTAFTNGKYQTSSVPEQAFDQQPYKLQLNELYLGNLIANLRQGNGSATRGELDGAPAMLFTLKEEFQNPNPPEYNQPIQNDEVTAYFDLETGLMRLHKTIVTLADGSTRLFEQMRLSVERLDEPPPAVVEFLENSQTP